MGICVLKTIETTWEDKRRASALPVSGQPVTKSYVPNPRLIWFEEIEKKRNRDITSGC